MVDGLVTNIAIHEALLGNETFLEGRMTTNLLDRVGSAAFLPPPPRVVMHTCTQSHPLDPSGRPARLTINPTWSCP